MSCHRTFSRQTEVPALVVFAALLPEPQHRVVEDVAARREARAPPAVARPAGADTDERKIEHL